MSKDDFSAFHALDPFFSIVMEGLSKYTDGEHYFDTLADDVLFEFRYHMAGWPEAIRGRANLMSLYSGYGNSILLERGDALAAHPSADGHVWPSNTRFTARYSRPAYDNRFVSIAFIENRKIVRWRDYMDSLAAWTALTSVA
jgi:uncharacterized protein